MSGGLPGRRAGPNLAPMLRDQHATEFDRLHRVPEVAERLALSQRQVWSLIERGALRAVRIGRCTRIRESELLRLLDSASRIEEATDATP